LISSREYRKIKKSKTKQTATIMSEIWDCHLHVIGDRALWPLAPDRGYEPPHAPVELLLSHLDEMGADKGVLVQPSVYGFDNGCLLAALEQHPDRLRGIVVPNLATPLKELARMHDLGVRGVRCNLVNSGGITLNDTRPWWGWMQDHGWHIQLQAHANHADFLPPKDQLPPLKLVLDHLGFPRAGFNTQTMRPLLDALASGQIHVKLSAPGRFSALPAPHTDVQALVRRCLELGADHCLWASDWPHTDCVLPVIEDRFWYKVVQDLAGDTFEPMHATAAALYQ
jgi:predicted TIM-barrel fold metal-dependent hydrolase